MSAINRLLVVSHVPHYRHGGRLYAYGPYVREIDVWCDLFPQVVIAAPCHDGPPPGDGRAFARDNVSVFAIPKSGGDTIGAKLIQLFMLPWIVFRLCVAMQQADAIHVRCPGNLGLLGVILGPLFSRRLIAKYAGQWTGYPGEAWTVKLQRRLLASRWWRGVVTVYGQWPDQPDHVIPFFTSVMTERQIARARQIAFRDKSSEPFTVVFVGRLSKAKNVDVIIEAVSQLVRQGIDARCHIIGQGAELEFLQRLVNQRGLQDQVHFAGGVDFDCVFDYHDRSHVLVLASETEGWPKAIAEAMACGLVCVGSDRGLVPWMLGQGRGFVVPPGDSAALTEILQRLAQSSDLRREVSQRAAEFGQRYSLESLRNALAELMSDRWGTPIGKPALPGDPHHGGNQAVGTDSQQAVL